MEGKCEAVRICDCEESYKAGRRDMRDEIAQMITNFRFGTLGVIRSVLSDLIEKVRKLS
jgi:predicted YcjX-like family ATPase